MKQNVGIADTALRSIIACVAIALALEGMFSPAINVVLLVMGAALWFSASFGICLVYRLLGIDTYPDFRDDSLTW